MDIYIVEVMFVNVAQPEGEQEDFIEFAIPASSYGEAEKKAIEECGEFFWEITGIFRLESVYLG